MDFTIVAFCCNGLTISSLLHIRRSMSRFWRISYLRNCP